MNLEMVSTFLASFLIWFMFAGLLVLWIFRKGLRTYQVLHILTVIFIVFLITDVIKGTIPANRPFVTDGIDPLTITIPKDNSFPSAHAAIAFSLTFGIYKHNKKYGMIFLLPATLVGVGRIISYVHAPVDVVGGILVALLVVVLLGHRRLLKVFDRPWITS